jgi:putative multiple sugar transport system permease protein
VIGCFQGFWIAYLKIPAFIVTLAGSLLFRGLTYIITNVTPIALRDDNYKKIASGTWNIESLSTDEVHYTAIAVAVLVVVVYVVFEMLAAARR